MPAAPADRIHPTPDSQFAPAPKLETSPRPELQTPPASSSKARSLPIPKTKPIGWPKTAAGKTSPHRMRDPNPPSVRPDQETLSAHTTAAPPLRNPVPEFALPTLAAPAPH